MYKNSLGEVVKPFERDSDVDFSKTFFSYSNPDTLDFLG